MNNKDTSYSNFALRLILVCTILILGSTVIFALNSSLENNKTEKGNSAPENNEEKELINKLYRYVSYGRELQPMYYFIKNKELTKDTFDNYEKVGYAFQFASKSNVKDLTDKGFTVDGAVYKEWIETIFGKGTTYDNSKVVTLFTNSVLKNSIVNIEYNKEKDQYVVTKIDGFIKEKNLGIDNFYYKLDSYNIDNVNKDITIKEKFIFVAKELSNDQKSINNIKVYKDIYQTKLIDEIKKPTKERIKKFSINSYLEDANVIAYTFKLDEDNNYYLYSTKVSE